MSLDDCLSLYIDELEANQPVENGCDAERLWGRPVGCNGFDGECGCKTARWRRQNTQYIDRRANWVFMCDDCYAANEDFWAERWRDYYASMC